MDSSAVLATLRACKHDVENDNVESVPRRVSELENSGAVAGLSMGWLESLQVTLVNLKQFAEDDATHPLLLLDMLASLTDDVRKADVPEGETCPMCGAEGVCGTSILTESACNLRVDLDTYKPRSSSDLPYLVEGDQKNTRWTHPHTKTALGALPSRVYYSGEPVEGACCMVCGGQTGDVTTVTVHSQPDREGYEVCESCLAPPWK